MKRLPALLLPLSIGIACLASAALADDPAPTPVPAANPDEGFHNVSEAGLVITTGNARSQTYNLSQGNSYGWDTHVLRARGKFLRTSTGGTLSAYSWLAGLRYEEAVTPSFSAYAGQELESNVFTGYRQRYNTDVGGKYFIQKLERFDWFGEAGYRYTVENYVTGAQNRLHFARLYTEANRAFNASVSGRLWVEYLPDLEELGNYRLNTEASVNAMLTQILSIKTGYLVKYISRLIPGQSVNTDTVFTTALVAKF